MLFDQQLKQFFRNISQKPRLHFNNLLVPPFEQQIHELAKILDTKNPRQLAFHIETDLSTRPNCYCGNNLRWHYNRYLEYCSVRCSSLATKQSRISTTKAKYGVDNYSKSNEFKIKSKQTFISKYGVDNPSKSIAVQEQKRITSVDRYGSNNYSQSHLSQETIKIINNKDRFLEIASGKSVSEVAEILGMSYSGPIKVAYRHGLGDIFVASTRSQYELKIERLLESIDVTFIKNSKKIIPPMQLDFYLPEKNLAIEVGSMYFHCENSSGRGKNYHRTKWEECQKRGITLLQYFDDDIIDKWEIVESKIRRLCGLKLNVIGARKTSVAIGGTSPKEESKFLDDYHLQGKNLSRTHVISARYNECLVGIMSIKLGHHQTAEIVRYAVDRSHSYPGLFTKMLKEFLLKTRFTGIITSFSDNRHSNGHLYKASGFQLEYVTASGYSYTKNYLKRENRLRYQKHLLGKRFGLDEALVREKTEWEIMQLFGYDRLWDAGQSKWTLRI